MEKNNNRFLSYLGFILALLLPLGAILPLFHPGFFTIHDDQQIARLFDLTKVFSSGIFPPRWVPDLGFGYGYPLFDFYPPLVYYIGFIFHRIGFSLIDATKLVVATGFILSSLFMYLWTKNRFGLVAGIVAAALYTYIPYHSEDIYVRGALAEFFSFVWIPAVFWTLDNLSQKRSYLWMVLSAVFTGFVVLTHNLIALPFLLFLGPYMLYLLYEERKNIKAVFPLFFGVGLFSLGLTCYFWLPSLVEKQYTLVDAILTRELADYSIHFVYLSQLWNSPWGYGGSTFGLEDGLSFQFGKIQFVTALLGMLISLYLWISKRKEDIRFSIFLFCLFLGSISMVSFFSKPLWDILKPLWYLQFSWRFLLFTSVFSCSLAAAFVGYLSKLISPKIVLFIAGIIIVINYYLVSSMFTPTKYLDVTDSFYTENNDIQWRVSRSSFEYIPKEVKTETSSLGTTVPIIHEHDIPSSSYVQQTNLAVIQKGNSPTKKIYEITGTGLFTVNTFYFPGWMVYQVQGDTKTPISIHPSNDLHLIQFPVDSKQGSTYEVVYEGTQTQHIANFISLLTLGIILGGFLYTQKGIYGKKKS